MDKKVKIFVHDFFGEKKRISLMKETLSMEYFNIEKGFFQVSIFIETRKEFLNATNFNVTARNAG